jgi:mannose-6-phosphate isomerase
MQAIIKFEPIYKSKIWGGRKLETKLGRKIPDGNIGESWEISDYGNDCSKISNGELKGKIFRESYQKYRKEILGEMFQTNESFPLLIKIIDAKEKLSVQVHPDDKYALEKDPDSSGKKESWFILDSDENSEIVCGFSENLDRELYKKLIEENKADIQLQKFISKPNDSFIINPGTVHAIGGGNLLLEVQQSSDSTYRVYDYGRLENGKLRELHLNKALDVLNFKKSDGEELIKPKSVDWIFGKREIHITNDKFHLETLEFSKEVLVPKICSKNVFKVIHVLDGNFKIDSEIFSKGETFLITASSAEIHLSPNSNSVHLALMTVGRDWLEEIR